MASKARFKRKPLTEIELTAPVENLGQAGQRVRVAPGMMRNHLYPKRMALYVMDGRTLALDGSLGTKKAAPTIAGQSKDLTTAPDAPARRPVDEGKVIEQMAKLGPIRFTRKTTGQDVLHGSVTSQDVLSALQDKGVQLSDLEGEFQSQADVDGIENGRIKKVGEYLCKSHLLLPASIMADISLLVCSQCQIRPQNTSCYCTSREGVSAGHIPATAISRHRQKADLLSLATCYQISDCGVA